MNRIEQIKSTKGGLQVGGDLPRFAEHGWEAIEEDDLERLKWWGIFFRKHTPGHFMMRIRIPNGITNAAQLRTIGSIATTLGRGIADITTRQQMQLRWLTIGDIPEVLRQLQGVGLVTLQTGMDNVRNVVGCPVAGLTPNELFDAAPVAEAFTRVFLGNQEFTNLPRKFNVTITGCRQNCTHAETQDLALVPAVATVRGEPIPGFNVLVGGKNGSGGYRIGKPLDVFVRVDEAPDVCAAIVLLFRDHGARDARNRVRLAFLLEEWGEPKFRDALESRLGRPLLPAGEDQRLATATDHVGVFRQTQASLNYIGLSVPVGRITGHQLSEVARLADAYGTGEVRLTADQNIILPHVSDARLGLLTKEPLLKVLRYDPSEIMRGLVSCTGIEFCNLAVIETKTRALNVARALEARVHHGKPIRMHWSGCPAGCGNHTVADIGLLGTRAKVDGKVVDAVDVFVGGGSGPRATQAVKLLESVPCDTLPSVLEGLVKHLEPDRLRRQLGTLAAASKPTPPPAPSQVDGVTVVRLEDVGDGSGRAFADGTIAVFRRGDCLYALDNRCPHAGGSLADGALDGNEVICPLHGYRFSLATGRCATDPRLAVHAFAVTPHGTGFAIKTERRS
jgi:ferredoxin-nitrite reductase